MNAFLSALAKACETDRLRAKVLVTPSRQAGLQAAEALALHGVNWINLHVMTPEDVAAQVLAAAPERPRGRPVPDSVCRLIMLKVVLESSRSWSLSAPVPPAVDPAAREAAPLPALADMMFRSVRDLAMAGLDPAAVDTPARPAARAYAAELDSRGWTDYPGVLRAAITSIQSPDSAGPVAAAMRDALFLAPSSAEFEQLEADLLRLVSGGDLRLLPCDGDGGAGAGSVHSAVLAADVSLFSAVGSTNEVREAFRRIITSGIPVDCVEIVYTSLEAYVPIIFSLANELGVPVTFGGGVPAHLTAPGRALLGFIDWVSSGFPSAALRRLITSGDISMPPLDDEDPPGAEALSRVLIDAGIGWGRDRYRPRLESLASQCERDGDETALLRARAARYLVTLVGALSGSLPGLDGTMDLAALAKACAGFVGLCAHARDPLDREHRQALLSALEERAAVAGILLPAADALRFTREWLLRLRISPSAPRPGHLHASGFENGGASGRKHTFVVGLDSASFPGTATQDPLLPDDVRRALSPALQLAAERPARNTAAMRRLVAGVRGSLTLGYSRYDVVEGRACSPAAVMLHVHRAVTGRPADDYSALTKALGRPAGFQPAPGQAHLTSSEWWLQALEENQSFRRCPSAVAKAYPGIARGLDAESARAGSEVTEFEGLTGLPFAMVAAAGQGAPNGEGRVAPCLSATAIEELARCPYAFFLKYVLRVRPPEELTYSPLHWLHPQARGSLLHRVFREVLERITARGETPSLSRHRAEAEAIADGITADYAAEIPAPGHAVFEQERREILSAVDILLRMEEEWAEQARPAYFELDFGSGTPETAPPGSPDPIHLPVGDRTSIALRGRVDRVDVLTSEGAGSAYVVWDYKTGSSREYDDGSRFKGGRRVQHAVYAAAAEMLLRRHCDPGARVVGSGYLFPTERGEGRRVTFEAVVNAGLTGILDAVVGILSSGAFTPTENGETCELCAYAPVCEGTGASEHIARKMPSSPALGPLRRLRSHE